MVIIYIYIKTKSLLNCVVYLVIPRDGILQTKCRSTGLASYIIVSVTLVNAGEVHHGFL